MARRMRGHRYRVRPRVFLFLAAILAVLVFFFWPRHAAPKPPRTAVPPASSSSASRRGSFKVPTIGWFAGQVLPGPAEGLSTVTADGDLIAVGGYDGTNSSTAVTAFGPAPLAVSLPVGVHDASVTVRQSTLYVLGGGTAVPTTTVQAVSLTGQATATPPALPEPLSDAASVSTPHGFLVVAGYTGTTYLPTVSSWTPGHLTVRAHLPEGLRYAAAAWYQGQLVVAGGLSTGGVSDHVYAVNVTTGQVSRLPSLPKPVYHAEMAVFRGVLVLVGGTVDGRATNATWVYNPDARRWVAGQPLPTPTADGSLAVYQGELWYVGGYNSAGPTAQVWVGRSS